MKNMEENVNITDKSQGTLHPPGPNQRVSVGAGISLKHMHSCRTCQTECFKCHTP